MTKPAAFNFLRVFLFLILTFFGAGKLAAQDEPANNEGSGNDLGREFLRWLRHSLRPSVPSTLQRF